MTTVLGVWGAAGAAVADASSWTIEPSVNPDGHGAILSSVSCTTAATCVAVGSTSNGQMPLAIHRGVGGWSIRPTPVPSAASGAILSGVSCHGSTCTAVGTSYGSDASPGSAKVLVERWNGESWRIQSAPSPSGAGNSGLDSVACSGADSCQAVGSTQDQYGQPVALGESWNGHHWSIDQKPPRAGVLTGVSCTSAKACTAGGWFQTNDAQVAIAERWNGTAWTVQATPILSQGTNYSLFSAVSCSAPLACTTVGTAGNASHGLQTSTLAEAWRGHAWSIQPTLAIGISQLLGVSCTRPDACTAVGDDEAPPGGGTTIQRWNGRVWEAQVTPLDNSPATLSSVSCPTLRSCTAVGASDTGAPLVERYAGP